MTSINNRIIDEFGIVNTKQVNVLFEEATNLAIKGRLEEAIKLSEFALNISEYSVKHYGIIYFLGFLIQLHLDIGNPEVENKYFYQAMRSIREEDSNFESDINTFLDLKIEIEKAQRNID